MRRLRASALLVAGVVLAAGCSSSSVDDRPVVEVFGSWRGVDAERFAAMIEPFEEETGIDVRIVGSASFVRDINDRATNAELPDVGLFPQPALISEFAQRGLLVPLAEATASSQRNAYRDAVAAAVDDTIYGVWIKAAVKSLVWYRPDTFAERGYDVPKTWADLVTLTEEIESDGMVPWCLSMESFSSTGWVGTDWIEDIVLRQQGPDLYDAWVSNEVSFEDAAIVAAFETFGELIHPPGRVLGGARRILNEPWQNAQTPMFDDDPGCLMNRQASFEEANLPSGVEIGEDVDVFGLPSVDGTEPPVLVAGNLAAAFNDRPEVQALLAYLATPESGKGWAELGGYTSPHPDFDPSWYANEFDRRVGEVLNSARVVRFDGSDLMLPAVGTGTFWAGIVDFVRDADARAAVAEIQKGYPMVEASEG
mgnify:FL=1